MMVPKQEDGGIPGTEEDPCGREVVSKGQRSNEAARDSVSGLDQPTERRGARVEVGTS